MFLLYKSLGRSLIAVLLQGMSKLNLNFVTSVKRKRIFLINLPLKVHVRKTVNSVAENFALYLFKKVLLI